MKNEMQIWETLTSQYIRKVERALARVDHPRKKEVLQDVRNHLEERYNAMSPERRTPENLAAAIADMEPPEEYAELLAPATGAAPRKWYRRRATYVVLGAVAALGIARYLCLPDNHLGLRVRDLLGVNYSAPPFFSKENFERIQPGMTADEVRDLVGCPIWRGVLVGEDAMRCEYTAPVAEGAFRYQEFSILFDIESQRVLRTSRHHVTTSDKSTLEFWNSTVRSVAGMKRKIGNLQLTRSDGTERVLRPSDDNISLIYLAHSTGERPVYPEEFGWLKAEGIPVLYLVIKYDAKQAQTGFPDNVFRASHPKIEMTDHRQFVYSKGILYRLPLKYYDCQEDWEADRQWLVRRLLQ